MAVVQAAHAFKGWLGVGSHETDLDSLRAAKVARTAFARYHDLEITHDQGEEVDPTGGRADPEGVALGDYDVRLRGTLEGTTEGAIPYLLRSVLGGQPTTTTVGTTGQQHLFEAADALPLDGGRLSYEKRAGTAAEAEIGNLVCDSLEFNITQAGYARWPFTAIGSSPEYLAPPTAASLPSMSSVMSQRNTTFTFNGGTTKVVRSLSWRIQRAISDDDYDVGSRQRRDASYGGLTTSFDAEVTFVDMTALREFWGGAAVNSPGDTEVYYPVNIKTEKAEVIPGGTAHHTVELDLPKAFVTRVSRPQRGRDLIRQRITGRAIYDPTGGVARAQRVKIVNTVAAY